VSGSSIANVVTTGTFTIPLMKKVGFSPEKAGAVEVACSTNGQLMPPVMGAAAFLMVEYVGISYIEVIKHAFLPAIISYVALVYIVHLEACKGASRVWRKKSPGPLLKKCWALSWPSCSWSSWAGRSITAWAGSRPSPAATTKYVVAAILLTVAYLLLLAFACKVPEAGYQHPVDELPRPGADGSGRLLFSAAHRRAGLVPDGGAAVAGLSAFWATAFMIFILSHPAAAEGDSSAKRGRHGARSPRLHEFVDGLIAGARNMIGIGVATGGRRHHRRHGVAHRRGTRSSAESSSSCPAAT
jgi:TRAP-type uncharacterized transport system fused permease subunit